MQTNQLNIKTFIKSIINEKLEQGLIVIEYGLQSNNRGCSPYAMFTPNELFFHNNNMDEITKIILEYAKNVNQCAWRYEKLYFGAQVAEDSFGDGSVDCDGYAIAYGLDEKDAKSIVKKFRDAQREQKRIKEFEKLKKKKLELKLELAQLEKRKKAEFMD